MQKNTEPALKREVGATALALNAMNLTIGSGIFVLPALVALKLGAAAFIAYIFCAVLMILVMLCFAEIGSGVNSSGGAYAYVEKAFGPLPGFLINSIAWFGFSALADAAVVNAIADMLAIWVPAFSGIFVRIIFFVAVFGLLVWINIRGVKSGSQFAVTATVIKLVPLLLLVVIGMFSIHPQNLAVTTWPGISSIGETSLLLFFSFAGVETALNIGGEIKNPRRNIPKGIFMAVAGILIVYLLIQFVVQGVMGNDLQLFKEAPLAATAARLIGPVGGTIIVITAVISMFGMLSGDVLASPRILYAASVDKLLPGFLGRIHPKFATPYWSIIVYAATGCIMACSGGFKSLAVLSSSSVLLIYLAVVLATISLRFKNPVLVSQNFRIPGGLTIPVLAIIVIGWFLWQVTQQELIAFAIFFTVATVLYFLNIYLRKQRS